MRGEKSKRLPTEPTSIIPTPKSSSHRSSPKNNPNPSQYFLKCSTSKRSIYLLTYCVAAFVDGCMFTATTLILTYLQELLKINESESSLIYTVSYIGQIVGSILGGKIVSQQRWLNTHF